MKAFNNILETIGNTPLVRLEKLEKKFNLQAKLYAKVESFNPGGSIKDRIALMMIEDAINEGKINKDTVIIEPTSGNTGIGLALVSAYKDLRLILTMPESMSIERRKLLAAYGAEIVLTPASLGMKGAIAKAEELAKEYPNSFIPLQFNNPSNPKAHYLYTGREIYEALDGKVDIFVASFGTGGTVSGTAKYLKEQNKDLKVIGVEPLSSPVVSQGKAGPHKIQGIGAGFIPETLDTSILNEVIAISDEDAFQTQKEARSEGLLVGISSGAALKAALEVASRKENKNKNVVVILPDNGERYLSVENYI